MPRKPSGVRALLFDFDETLVPDEANVILAMERAIAPVLPGTHLNPRLVVAAIRNHAQRIWDSSPYYTYLDGLGVSADEGLWAGFGGDGPLLAEVRAWAVERYRPAVWEGLMEVLEREHETGVAAQLSATFQEQRRALGRVPYPDVVPALDRLSPRFPLALVTNGLSDLQREKVAVSGLGARFQAIIVSGEVGHGKPEPQAFHAACSALAVPPEAAIMVGDSIDRDVRGARAAGLPVVWVNRDGATAPPGAKPDYEVTDLSGLVELLA